jgi:hypothetical protein
MKLGLVLGLLTLLVAESANAAEERSPFDPPPQQKFSMGPTVTMGAPSGLGGGLSTRFYRLVGVDARAGYVPWLTIMSGTKVSRISYEGDLRVYPSREAFFIGVAGGYAQLHAAAADTVASGTAYSQRVSARAGLDYAYVRPELGWIWAFENGMTLGFRAGAEIPVWHAQPTVSASATSAVGTTDVSSKAGAATTALAYVGSHPIPAVTLIEVGFLL